MHRTEERPLAIARWIDTDLHESLDETLRYRSARLFAVNITDDGFTRELIDCDPDPYELLTRLPSAPALDAACLVMTGWMSRVRDDDDDDDDDNDESDDNETNFDEPDDGPERFRVRVVAVVEDQGVGVVVRRWTDEGVSDSFADGGEGMFPDALTAWWSAYRALRTPREDR